MAIPPGKEEALKAIRLCLQEDRLHQVDEFRLRLRQRNYTLIDVYRVLRVGKVDQAPRWREEHSNFEVRIRGRTLDGRLTRVVLGLAANLKQGLLVTVIPLER